MISVFFTPIYALLLIYIIKRTLQWIGACISPLKAKWFTIVFSTVIVLLAVSPVIAFFMPDIGAMTRIVRRTSTYSLGVLLYTVMFLAFVDILTFILKKTKFISKKVAKSKKAFIILGVCIVFAVSGMSIYGRINAANIKTKSYDITINKACSGHDNMTIALVADLHLGYSIGLEMMEDMVDKINAMDADIVVIAGDIFDNDYNAIYQPEKIIECLKRIESKYGVYACYGNHDVEENTLAGFTFKSIYAPTSGNEMYSFLEKAGIKLLQDESVLIDNSFYLTGRIDYSKPGREEQRKTPNQLLYNLDKSKPIIVIDHQPRELSELAQAGADLDLSGHTHDGQMFPGNLIINFFWENACGKMQKDNMTSIVTSGVGLFGPNMRTFTDSEVVKLNVKFKSSDYESLNVS